MENLGNDEFTVNCARLALKHYPQNINAKLLWAEVLNKRMVLLMKQQKAKSLQQVIRLPKGKLLHSQMEKLYGEIVQSGYREMPKQMYLNWLTSVNNYTQKDSKQIERIHNPKADPFDGSGKKVNIISLGNGLFDETHADDNDTLLRIGSVIYNQYSRRIAYLIEKEVRISEANLEPEVTSRWMAIDPAADKYESLC